MKKKVALLLVLVMILGSLPMNVFGNVANTAGSSTVSGGFTAENRNLPNGQEFTVNVPLSSIWSLLRADMGGAGNGNGQLRTIMTLQHSRIAPDPFANLTPTNPIPLDSIVTGAGLSGLNASDPQVLALIDGFEVLLLARSIGTDGLNESVIEIRVTSAAALNVLNSFLTANGVLSFRVPLQAPTGDWENARLSLAGQLAYEARHMLISNWNLVWRHAGVVTIARQGAVRGFTSSLPVPPIRVSESLFGTIAPIAGAQTVTLQLRAPEFYTWAFGNNVSATNMAEAFPVIGTIIPGRPGTTVPLSVTAGGSLQAIQGVSDLDIVNVRSVRGTGTEDRHHIYITLSLANLSHLNPLTGWFQVNNLWLTPDYHAPETGEVWIDARLGRWDAGTGATAGIAPVPPHYTNIYAFEWIYTLGDQVPLFQGDYIVWILPASGSPANGTFIPAGRIWPNPATPTGSFAAVFVPNPASPGDMMLARPAGVPSNAIPALCPVSPRGTGGAALVRVEQVPHHGVPIVLLPNTATHTVQWFNSPTPGVMDSDRIGTAAAPATPALLDIIANMYSDAAAHAAYSYLNPNFADAHWGGYWFLTQANNIPITAAAVTNRLNTIMLDQNGQRVVLGQQFHPGTPGTDGTDGTTAGFGHFTGQRGYNFNIHVGNRGGAELTASVYSIRDMRTGHLGVHRASTSTASLGTVEGVSNVAWNRDNAGIAHYTGVATGTLVIEETVPGGFVVGFGSPIHFEFLDEDGNTHPGISILGVQARAGNNRVGYYRNNHFRGFHTGNQGWASNYERQNWMTFAGWMSSLDNRLPNVAGVGRISDERATIYLPSQTISDVTSAGAVEIRFFLSLEAGYEWKYGDGVYVTLSGSGISNLPEDQRRVRIGNAVDPIIANITDADFEVTEVDTGTLYNIIGREAVSDVVFDIVDPNAFRLGDEIWVYVTSDVLARNFDLNLSNIPTLTMTEGNNTLRFDSGRLVNPTAGGRIGRQAVVFTVTRSANSVPAQFTISNLNVEGQAWPGVNYRVVLSGTAVANNDQEVYHALRQNTAQGTVIRHMNRGVFTTLPYHGIAIENVSGGLGELLELPPSQQNREFRLQVGAPLGGVDEPFIWHYIGQNRFGMVALRAFGYMIGAAEEDIVWNPEADGGPTANVTAPHFNGEIVQIAVQMNNPRATVRVGNQEPAQPDIATVTYGNASLAGTVTPINVDGRIYLPLRFMAETFGFTVDMVGNVVIFR